MTITFTIKLNKPYIICDDMLLTCIRERFSIPNPGKAFSESVFSQARISAITAGGRFDIGLFEDIRNYVVAEQLATSIVVTDEFWARYQIPINIPVYNEFSLSLRDYQYETVEQYLKRGRGMCLLGTGAGKTLIMASLCMSLISDNNKKCLIMVPDPGLARQTASDFISYNSPITPSIWTGAHEVDRDARIVVASHSILVRILKDDKTIKWLNTFDYLVLDEVHTVKEDSKIQTLVGKLKTKHKFGLTATLPNDELNKWHVVGSYGPILYEKSSAELRDEDYLAKVSVLLCNVSYKSHIKKRNDVKRTSNARFHDERAFLYNNSFRQQIINKLCGLFSKNILILVDSIEFGEILKRLISQSHPNRNVSFIRGSTDSETRDRVKAQMEIHNNLITIAMSAIFARGINITNIHMVMFGVGGKSEVRVIQSIGRGLRKHPSKTQLQIVDFQDMTEYALQHTSERLKIYEQEKIPIKHTSFIEK